MYENSPLSLGTLYTDAVQPYRAEFQTGLSFLVYRSIMTQLVEVHEVCLDSNSSSRSLSDVLHKLVMLFALLAYALHLSYIRLKSICVKSLQTTSARAAVSSLEQ